LWKIKNLNTLKLRYNHLAANAPFKKNYIDHVGPIAPKSSAGYDYILTISCDLTKYAIDLPVFDCTALSTAVALVDNVFLKFNIPKIIVSDNGSAFISDLYKEITKLLNIRKILTAPYHAQSNAVERYHRSLGEYMRAYANKEPDN